MHAPEPEQGVRTYAQTSFRRLAGKQKETASSEAQDTDNPDDIGEDSKTMWRNQLEMCNEIINFVRQKIIMPFEPEAFLQILPPRPARTYALQACFSRVWGESLVAFRTCRALGHANYLQKCRNANAHYASMAEHIQ